MALENGRGYSSGVPKRLNILPWYPKVNRLRAIRFEKLDDVQWDLLAMLNVKNLISINKDFYFNSTSFLKNLKKMEVYKNPYKPLPRVFFTSKIYPQLNILIDNLSYHISKPILLLEESNKVLVSWNSQNTDKIDYYCIDIKNQMIITSIF